MSQRDNRDRVQRLTLSGVLLGVMLVLGAVEHALPSFALPGVKLGLSNSVLIFAIYMLDLPTAWILMALKVSLSGFLFGNLSAMMYAFAGGVLNIKPVVTVKDGDVIFLGKARGSKKANNFLIEQIGQSGIDYEKPVLLGYTGTSDEMLREYIEESRDLWEGKVDRLCCEQLCSVIGTHAGPGGVAVAFFRSSAGRA